MRQIDYQDIEDILFGCTIMGTGGGGTLSDGIHAVNAALEKGKKFYLLEFDEIDNERYYVNPYFCGSILPERNEYNNNKLNSELIYAINGLQEYMDLEFHGIVSVEYGGGNTGQCMAAAAMLNKFIVDADAAGRAVPELQFSTYHVTGQPIFPFAVATKYEDVAIFTKVASDERAEALTRMMAVATENLVGMADHPIKGDLLRQSVIPNALSYAQNVGKARRLAIKNNEDPIEAIIKAGEGKLICKGIVTEEDTNFEINDGFTTGEIGIKGIDKFERNDYRIWYRNENMIIWENNVVKLTCPDLICVVNLEDGHPFTNPNCKDGDEVAIIAFEAHSIWKSEKGLSILNPRFFGFNDINIVDISTLK